MSLINQMLQDLEKRQSGIEVSPLTSVRAVPRQHNMAVFWVLLLVLFLAVAGVIGWLLWDKYFSSPGAETPAIAEAPKPIKPAVVAPAPQPAPETLVQPAAPAAPVPAEPAPAAPQQTGAPAAELDTLSELPAQPPPKAAAPAPAPKPKPPAQPATSSQPAADSGSIAFSKQIRELTPQQRAENEYRKALSLAQQGRTSEAISGLEQAVRIDPRHVAAMQTLIGLLLESKRFGDAERRLKETLSLDPAQPDLAMMLARLQLERGDTGAAIATLDRSQHAAANHAEYYGFMAALLQRENYHREAIVQYRQALRLAPGNAVWLMGLGISLQADKNFPEAREAYSRARASGTLSPELQAFVEQRLRQLGQSGN